MYKNNDFDIEKMKDVCQAAADEWDPHRFRGTPEQLEFWDTFTPLFILEILERFDELERYIFKKDPSEKERFEQCEYCGNSSWEISATIVTCCNCGLTYNRVNDYWRVDPESIPKSPHRLEQWPFGLVDLLKSQYFINRTKEILVAIQSSDPKILNEEDTHTLVTIERDVTLIRELTRHCMYVAASALRMRITPVANEESSTGKPDE